ncbi:MAG: type II secretion system GspH family protein [Ruminococcus sp.]|nr:type II secretion system GspH family protein [Ruminococcus sp.]
MNKKGFTLIELLSTITIMGLIATVASINIVKIFDNKDSETENTKHDIITTAACLYIELESNSILKEQCLTDGCLVSTTTLINAGLLYEEDIEKEEIVKIYKDKQEKKCVIE